MSGLLLAFVACREASPQATRAPEDASTVTVEEAAEPPAPLASAGTEQAQDAGSETARDAGSRKRDAGSGAEDAGGREGGAGVRGQDAGPYWPLGMNDVTVLTPRPTGSAPVLLAASDLADDGAPLISRALYDTVAVERACYQLNDAGVCDGAPSVEVLLANFYEDLHLVALRFDLCDRNLPGPCGPDDDARLRLIFQPLIAPGEFYDAGLHASYAIPRAQLGAAISALRALARLQAEPVSAPLKPSPALSDPGKTSYAEGLRKFVRAYAGEARLQRLTINAQPTGLQSVRWVLRGIERAGDGSFKKLVILDSPGTSQLVLFSGDPSYDVMPATNNPMGLSTALRDRDFAAASEADKKAALEALLFVDNPLKSAPGTVTCAACHTSTVLYAARAPKAGLDSAGLSGRYTSTYDLSIDAGVLPTSPRTLRALGYSWFVQGPVISTRVVNETAQVLSEIEQRFPP